MKKLLMGLGLVLGFVSAVSAQTAAKATTKPVATDAKVVTMQPKPAATTKVAPAAKSTATTTTAAKTSATTTGAKVKADGTPDMRYKDNKAAKTATGPKKADGTPDMRYKNNKTPKAKS